MQSITIFDDPAKARPGIAPSRSALQGPSPIEIRQDDSIIVNQARYPDKYATFGHDKDHRQSSMEQTQLETFREALILLKDELEQLHRESLEASDTVVLDQSKVGRLSRMDALQGQQMAQETARRRQVQLQKVENSLKRIETGDYGYCLVCGEEITLGRLQFDPACTRCIGCVDS